MRGRRILPGALALLLACAPAAAQTTAQTTAAQHTAADDLLGALTRSRSLAARGQAEVTVLFPPRAVPTRVAGALPVVVFRPGLIAKNFQVVRAEGGEVAGRATTRFDLRPKVGQAAHWSLWVDQVWNVPLAFEERSAAGILARRAALTSVNGTPAKVNRPLPAVPAGLGQVMAAALPGFKAPPGFVPTGLRLRENGSPELTLSDGVNTLALVVAPRGVKAAPGVASRQVGQKHVWLVGNLPGSVLAGALAKLRGADAVALGTFASRLSSNP